MEDPRPGVVRIDGERNDLTVELDAERAVSHVALDANRDGNGGIRSEFSLDRGLDFDRSRLGVWRAESRRCGPVDPEGTDETHESDRFNSTPVLHREVPLLLLVRRFSRSIRHLGTYRGFPRALGTLQAKLRSLPSR